MLKSPQIISRNVVYPSHMSRNDMEKKHWKNQLKKCIKNSPVVCRHNECLILAPDLVETE